MTSNIVSATPGKPRPWSLVVAKLPAGLLTLSLVGGGLLSAGAADESLTEVNLVAHVGTAAEQAKKPGDLDGLLTQLHELSQRSPTDGPSQRLLTLATAAFQFTTCWQDYLQGVAMGDTNKVRAALEQILNDRQIDRPLFLPRSEVLDREAKALGYAGSASSINIGDALDALFNRVKTVDDIQPAISKAAQLTATAGPDYNWDWQEMTTYGEEYDHVKAGFPEEITLHTVFSGPVIGTDISRFKAMYLLDLIPRSLGTGKTRPPRSGETVRDYLVRLEKASEQTENWPLFQRIVALQVVLCQPAVTLQPGGEPYFIPLPFDGTKHFLAGLSMDVGEQYAEAVFSYETALANPDSFLPVKLTGQRLAKIQAEHPAEFQQGLKKFALPALRPEQVWRFQPGVPLPQPAAIALLPMMLDVPSQSSGSNTPVSAPKNHH